MYQSLRFVLAFMNMLRRDKEPSLVVMWALLRFSTKNEISTNLVTTKIGNPRAIIAIVNLPRPF